MPVHRQTFQVRRQPAHKIIAELLLPLRVARPFPPGQLGCHAQSYNPRDIQRAGAETPLMPPSVNLGGWPDAGSNVQCADPLGAIELVGAQGEQVDVHRADVQRHGRRGLRGIGVERDPGLAAQRPNSADRGNRADLVVRGHHAHGESPRSDRPPDIVGIHQAPAVHLHPGDLEACPLEPVA